jgi:hypothetical protein
MNKRFTFLALAVALVLAGFGVAPAAASGNGTVTVIHGVPGLTVDVYVNGALTLEDFAPDTVTAPLSLPEGNYNIVIVPANGDPGNPAISGSAFLPAGANVSIIAHLTEAGAPTLSVFVNDVSKLRDHRSRLIVRHTAAAPTVDIALYRSSDHVRVRLIENLSNPEEAATEVTSRRYFAKIFPADSKQVVFGPATLRLRSEMVTIVYAVGSLGDGTFKLLVQTIDLDD